MNIFVFIVFLLLMLIQKRIYKIKNAQVTPYLENRPIYPSSKVTQVFGQARGILFFIGLIGVSKACFWPDADVISMEIFLQGLSLSLLGISLLKWSLNSLGVNYAPCNLVRMPESKVTRGPYRFYGHPIYLSNLLILGGILWTCPNILGFISWLGVTTFYLFSARDENRALALISKRG